MPLPQLLRRLIAAIAALLIGASPAGAEAPGDLQSADFKGPALWKLADQDTTIWLFGTIHVLPTTVKWETPAIKAAVQASDALVIETVIGPDPQAASQLLLRMGISPDLPPLMDRIKPDRRDALADMIRRSKLQPEMLDRLETWAAAMLLVGATVTDLGLDGASGVEAVLQRVFTTAGKPVEGLETPMQQLGYLDTLPEEAQRDFLMSVVDEPATVRAEFDRMLLAWRQGDEKGIARSFDDEVALSPELRDALLRRRNLAWTDWLIDRLDKPGTYFVAVGAGHLAGPDSVQRMLRKRGFKAERVQ